MQIQAISFAVSHIHSKILEARPYPRSNFLHFHAVVGKVWTKIGSPPPLGNSGPVAVTTVPRANHQSRIQDTGGTNPKGGAANLLSGVFLHCMKMKEIGPGLGEGHGCRRF